MLALVLSLACGPKVPPPPAPVAMPWAATHFTDHPFVGRIWDVSRASWVDEPTLISAVQSAQYVLLGEKHDHPDHHALQRRLVTTIAGPDVQVAFEMLDVDDPIAGLTEAAAIASAAEWDRSGWDVSMYLPIVEAALAKGAGVAGASPARASVRTVTVTGLSSLPADLRTALGLDAPIPEDWRIALEKEISVAHCDTATAPLMLSRMVEAQRLKDATMAGVMRQHAGPSILIAGTGHTRTDRGVPAWLTDRPTVVVHFVEVDPEETQLPSGGPADFLWFTPVVSVDDPCVLWKEQIEKMSQPQPSADG